LKTMTRTTSRCVITNRHEVREMSISNTRQLQRRAVHPGEILRKDFIPDDGLTESGIASQLGVSRQSINELLSEC
jgi:hypothetical protein